jgi:hypothetical protein
MKDGDNLSDYLASAQATDDSDPDVVLDSGSDSVPEESDTQPQPRSDPEYDHVIDPRITYMGNVHDDQAPPRAKPEWCTEAWDHLAAVALSPIDVIRPVCPKEFQEEVHSNVFAFDQPGFQTQSDSKTGETIVPSEDDELIAGIVGVVWNGHYPTTTRSAGQGKSGEEFTLGHFANVISLCPEGAVLSFQTHSAWLVQERDMMMQSRELGDEGLDRAD